MDIVKAITQRASQPKLAGEPVSQGVMDQLIQCALRAPDHARLRPSRYISVEGDDRAQLGEIFLTCIEGWQTLSSERQNKYKNMLLRAPTILFCVTRVIYNPKVPREEQLMSTAAGIQSMLIAAKQLGLGAMWRTGDMAYNRAFMDKLGLSHEEELVGIIYFGTPAAEEKKVPELASADFHSHWVADAE